MRVETGSAREEDDRGGLWTGDRGGVGSRTEVHWENTSIALSVESVLSFSYSNFRGLWPKCIPSVDQ